MINRFSKFKHYVTPMGKDYLEFLLYGLRSEERDRVESIKLTSWPDPTTLSYYELGGEDWPALVDLITIHVPLSSIVTLDALTSAMESMVSEGAIVSWYMFDGAFGDISDIFNSWEVVNTYGIYLPEQGAFLALTEEERTKKEWQLLLSDARRIVYQRFPTLKAL